MPKGCIIENALLTYYRVIELLIRFKKKRVSLIPSFTFLNDTPSYIFSKETPYLHILRSDPPLPQYAFFAQTPLPLLRTFRSDPLLTFKIFLSVPRYSFNWNSPYCNCKLPVLLSTKGQKWNVKH